MSISNLSNYQNRGALVSQHDGRLIDSDQLIARVQGAGVESLHVRIRDNNHAALRMRIGLNPNVNMENASETTQSTLEIAQANGSIKFRTPTALLSALDMFNADVSNQVKHEVSHALTTLQSGLNAELEGEAANAPSHQGADHTEQPTPEHNVENPPLENPPLENPQDAEGQSLNVMLNDIRDQIAEGLTLRQPLIFPTFEDILERKQVKTPEAIQAYEDKDLVCPISQQLVLTLKEPVELKGVTYELNDLKKSVQRKYRETGRIEDPYRNAFHNVQSLLRNLKAIDFGSDLKKEAIKKLNTSQ